MIRDTLGGAAAGLVFAEGEKWYDKREGITPNVHVGRDMMYGAAGGGMPLFLHHCFFFSFFSLLFVLCSPVNKQRLLEKARSCTTSTRPTGTTRWATRWATRWEVKWDQWDQWEDLQEATLMAKEDTIKCLYFVKLFVFDYAR